MTSVHDFEARAADGSTVALRDYAGKHLLIVNTASKCGLTPQYEGLEALYQRLRGEGLEVMGFPCNQFLGQEPGTDEEIQEFCRTSYEVTFPVMARVDVNGPHATALYEFLRAEQPGDFGPSYGRFFEAISKLIPDAEPGDVRWNFTKFLVDPDGAVVRRFEPPVDPEEIGAELRALL